jgi:hypothetical protein
MKRKLPAISFSSLTDFIHCRRRYKHRKIDGLQVKPQYLPELLKMGRAWDSYIRYSYDGTDYLPTITPLQLSDFSQAKLNALIGAHKNLEINSKNDGLLGCQYKINVPVGQEQIVGYVDLAYEDHIEEVKLSPRPDFYKQPENLYYELGTNFMGNGAWEYADVKITRVPQLKPKPDESGEAFEERCYGDILSRPARYFIGWNRKTRTYGVRFWRSEFDLEEIFQTYVHVLRELKTTAKRGSWYPNHLGCHVPATCQYLPIKRTGVVSEELFEKREIQDMKGGDEN